jgi:hypothetical protein
LEGCPDQSDALSAFWAFSRGNTIHLEALVGSEVVEIQMWREARDYRLTSVGRKRALCGQLATSQSEEDCWRNPE